MPVTKSLFPKSAVGRKVFGNTWLSKRLAPGPSHACPRSFVFYLIASLVLSLFAVGWAYRFPSEFRPFEIGGMFFSLIAFAACATTLCKVRDAAQREQHRDPRRHVALLGMTFRLYFVLLHLAVFGVTLILALTVQVLFGWGIVSLSVTAGLLTIASLALLGTTSAIGNGDLALLGWFSDLSRGLSFTRPVGETWLLAPRLAASFSRDSSRDRSVQLIPRLLRACTVESPQVFSPADSSDRSQWTDGAPGAPYFRTRAEIIARLRGSLQPFLWGLVLGWLLLTLLHSVKGWHPPERTPSAASSRQPPPPKSSPQKSAQNQNPASSENKSGGGGKGANDSSQGSEKGGSSSKGGSGGSGDSQASEGNSAEKAGGGEGSSGDIRGNSANKQGGSSSKGADGAGDSQTSESKSRGKNSPDAKGPGESGENSEATGQGNPTGIDSDRKGSLGAGNSGNQRGKSSSTERSSGSSGSSSPQQGGEKGGSSSKGGSGDSRKSEGNSSGTDSAEAARNGESGGKSGSPGPSNSADKSGQGVSDRKGIHAGNDDQQQPGGDDQGGKAGEKSDGASSSGANAGAPGKASGNPPKQGQGGAGQTAGGPAADATSAAGPQDGEENRPPSPGPRPLDAAQEIVLDFPNETITGGAPDISGASRPQPGPPSPFGPTPATLPPPPSAKRTSPDSPLQATPNWIHERLRSPERKP